MRRMQVHSERESSQVCVIESFIEKFKEIRTKMKVTLILILTNSGEFDDFDEFDELDEFDEFDKLTSKKVDPFGKKWKEHDTMVLVQHFANKVPDDKCAEIVGDRKTASLGRLLEKGSTNGMQSRSDALDTLKSKLCVCVCVCVCGVYVCMCVY